MEIDNTILRCPGCRQQVLRGARDDGREFFVETGLWVVVIPATGKQAMARVPHVCPGKQSAEFMLNRDELVILGKIAERAHKVGFASGGPASKFGDVVGASHHLVRASPLWDKDLEIDVREPTLIAALEEMLVQLRSLEAAEQAAADMHDN